MVSINTSVQHRELRIRLDRRQQRIWILQSSLPKEYASYRDTPLITLIKREVLWAEKENTQTENTTTYEHVHSG